jgi:hypothetical protein
VIAVAGGILLALVVVILFVGFVAMVRDTFRFVWRHKIALAATVVALALWAAVSVAGLYSQPYSPAPNWHH